MRGLFFCLKTKTYVRIIEQKGVSKMQVDRSYLPYKSAREYQDRKMAKWMGFFLSEHTTSQAAKEAELSYVYNPPQQMDHDEIGQLLSDAFAYKNKVSIAMNRLVDERYVKIDGYVLGHEDTFVLLDTGRVSMDDIRAVEYI